MPMMYMLGVILTPIVIPKWIEIRVTLITNLIGLSISVLFIAPIFEDKNLPVMLVGLFFTGLFMGPLIIPNMAEMMHATQLSYPQADIEHANSLLSGMLNCMYGLG